MIIAAPFHQTGIKILNSRAPALIPPQPYVHLHVSFILTNASSPSPTYFSLPTSSTISKAIFSTLDTSSPLPPAFNSLNYLKRLSPAVGARFGEGEWHVIKMFSAKRLGDDLLGEIFGSGNVGKTWRKEWDAYPVLEPVLEESDLAPVRPDQGLYYVNGFERLISTMETEVSWFWRLRVGRRADERADGLGVQCRQLAAARFLRVHEPDFVGRVGGVIAGSRGVFGEQLFLFVF